MRKKKSPIFVIKQCELCHDEFTVNAAYKRQAVKRFCSQTCSRSHNGKSNQGRKHSKESRKTRSAAQSGKGNHFYGKHHSPETRKIMSLAKLGKSWDEIMINSSPEDVQNRKQKKSKQMLGEGNHFHGCRHKDETKIRISENHWNCQGENNPMFGKGHLLRGEKNGAWKGGVSLIYASSFDKELRTEIRKRDEFTCAICFQNGYDVHHVDYDKQNSDATNLITLCRSCHAKTNFNRESWKAFFKTRQVNK
jgi:hypothetical protein